MYGSIGILLLLGKVLHLQIYSSCVLKQILVDSYICLELGGGHGTGILSFEGGVVCHYVNLPKSKKGTDIRYHTMS